LEFLLDGFRDGILRALYGDPQVLSAARVTLQVSLSSTLLASVISLPLGYLLATQRFPGKGAVIALCQTLLGMPTVVIGLVVYGFLSRRGPLGFMDLLFAPSAIIIGLVILLAPVLIVFAMTALTSVDNRLRETTLTLGASTGLSAWTLVLEARFGLLAAILAAFGRAASEVGIAVILGGNIEGYTRTITTAIALESMKGEFGFGIALGVVLMSVVLVTNILVRLLQKS
jgi:tungstate transport system permease protein